MKNTTLEGHAETTTCHHFLYFDPMISAKEVAKYFSANGFDSKVIDYDLIEITCLNDFDDTIEVELKRGEYFFTGSADTYTQEEFDKLYKKGE